jgi:hypothetical protein
LGETDVDFTGASAGSPIVRIRIQFRIKDLLLATAIVAAFLGLARGLWECVAGPVIPRSRLGQLRPGMTKSEVSAILGSPQIVEGDHEWVYSRWGNPGWIEVYFDANGSFHSVNDESPFP